MTMKMEQITQRLPIFLVLLSIILLPGCISEKEICANIPLSVVRNECYFWSVKVNPDKSLCSEITDSFYRDECYLNVAVTKFNSSLCELIRGQLSMDNCYQRIAINTKNESLCDLSLIHI